MEIEIKVIKKDKDHAHVLRSEFGKVVGNEVIKIPWEDFNKFFTKCSWEFYYYGELPDEEIDKSLQRCKLLFPLIEKFENLQDIAEKYFSVFRDDTEKDFLYHFRLATKAAKN